jgi:hypothetical protein
MNSFVARMQLDHKSVQDAYNQSLSLMPSDLLWHLKMFGYWGMMVDWYNKKSDWH